MISSRIRICYVRFLKIRGNAAEIFVGSDCVTSFLEDLAVVPSNVRNLLGLYEQRNYPHALPG